MQNTLTHTYFSRQSARRMWPAYVLFAAGLLLGLYVTVSMRTQFSATSTVLMVAEPETQDARVPSTATKPILSNDLPALVTSESVLQPFAQAIKYDGSTARLKSHIRAKINFQSTLVPIQFTWSDSIGAVNGANTLADEVVKYYRRIATTRFDSLIADLDIQLHGDQQALTDLDNRLNHLAEAYPYIDTHPVSGDSSSASSVYQRLIDLKSSRDQASANIESDRAAAIGTSKLLHDAAPVATRDLVEHDPEYSTLRDQYAKDVGELRHVQSFGAKAYPGLNELRQIVANETRQLSLASQRASGGNLSSNPAYAAAQDQLAKANAQLAADNSKLAAIDAQIADLNNKIGDGSIAAEVAKIRRERLNKEVDYSAIATKLANVRSDRAEAASTGSVVVVDRAATASPVPTSNGKLIGPLVFILLTWLAIAYACANRDSIIKNSKAYGSAVESSKS